MKTGPQDQPHPVRISAVRAIWGFCEYLKRETLLIFWFGCNLTSFSRKALDGLLPMPFPFYFKIIRNCRVFEAVKRQRFWRGGLIYKLTSVQYNGSAGESGDISLASLLIPLLPALGPILKNWRFCCELWLP